MKALRWIVPLISLACVLLLTMLDVGRARTGPGPLHPLHAAVAALEQGANCDGCHEAGAGIAAKACDACHVAIGKQHEAHDGLHGRLDDATLAHCERCHSEHHGDGAPLITAHAFPRAGVPDPFTYDHRHVAFVLTGAHSKLTCVRCHAQANLQVAATGARFLGLSQQCTACHEDKHGGAFGGDCAGCHGQEKAFSLAPGFRHEQFALSGAHARVACKDCHQSGTAHDVAALKQTPAAARTCDQCHADPHGEGSAAPRALRFAGAADCARCHAAEDWKAATPSIAEHEALGFALPGQHAAVACNTCHGDGATKAKWNGAPPRLAQCAACHEHPHGAALMAAARASQGPEQGCADCHGAADADFKVGRIGTAMHAATGFRLETPHADVACAKCHVGETRAARFPGRDAADCRACHADVHRGQFDHDARFAQCTACHAEAHFQPAAFGVAAHATTTFPLTGAHDAVACAACHKDVDGGVRKFAGTPSDCAACHADVHKGLFDRTGRPKAIDGRTGCARCHDTQAFAPVAAAFDHGRWTGYQLEGAHQALACAACHPPGLAREGVHLGKAKGQSCASCHQDPHAGQFATSMGTDCARCHAQHDWRELHFDHQRDSRFALDATHAKLECGKCHVGYQVGTTTIVRYKPLGTTCGDCHRLGKNGEVVR